MMSEEGFENDESDYHTLPRARITRKKRGLEWFVCGGWKFLCTSCCDWLINICQRKKELKARTVWLGCPEKCEEKHPRNAIKNQKYNVFTFIPGVLYEQFKFFLNLYFLVVSCSQFVPALKIGYLYTYWAPLGFVLAVTITREAIDEFRRFQRDKEVNSQLYSKLTVRGAHYTVQAGPKLMVLLPPPLACQGCRHGHHTQHSLTSLSDIWLPVRCTRLHFQCLLTSLPMTG
jgi:phospholipid-translocating ATPase